MINLLNFLFLDGETVQCREAVIPQSVGSQSNSIQRQLTRVGFQEIKESGHGCPWFEPLLLKEMAGVGLDRIPQKSPVTLFIAGSPIPLAVWNSFDSMFGWELLFPKVVDTTPSRNACNKMQY